LKQGKWLVNINNCRSARAKHHIHSYLAFVLNCSMSDIVTAVAEDEMIWHVLVSGLDLSVFEDVRESSRSGGIKKAGEEPFVLLRTASLWVPLTHDVLLLLSESCEDDAILLG
jgi:hypothetical protein